jgi:hypothetical protein
LASVIETQTFDIVVLDLLSAQWTSVAPSIDRDGPLEGRTTI